MTTSSPSQMGLLGHVGTTSFVHTPDFISDAKLSKKGNIKVSQTNNHESAPDVIHDEDEGHCPR